MNFLKIVAVRVLFSLSGIMIVHFSTAQQTGVVEYPYLGIKFNIPTGWQGQEMEGGYIMGSDNKAGLLLMSTHDASTIEQLKQEAYAGFQLAEGTALQLAGEIENVGTVGVGARFDGFLEWNQASAYVIALLNPLGKGVTILSITTPQIYDNTYKELAFELANSIKFSQPKESPVAKEWSQTLKGAKLTYMSSSGSSDYSGGYSGSSTTEEIILCSDQSFSYSYNSNFSMSISAGDAFSDSSDAGTGTWKVETAGDGGATLVMQFRNGTSRSYSITYADSKTYLDGTRYFRTYDHGVCR